MTAPACLTTPRTSRAAARNYTEDIERRFLRWLYGAQRGYCEIVAGETNPADTAKIQLVMRIKDRPDSAATRKWLYFDPERPDLLDAAAAYICQLAITYGNVYVGVRLYDQRVKAENQRREAYALPSSVIFVDDAPAQPVLQPSLVVRTSDGSRHAYYKTDGATTKEDARRMAVLLNGDASGVDLTQLVRVPGTTNTKRGDAFAVHVESTGPKYQIDALRAMLPAAPVARRADGHTAAPSTPEAWSDLPDGDCLARSARYRKAFQNRPQLATIAAGERVVLLDGQGRRDDSMSAQRAAFVSNLLHLHQQAPVNEVRALALHYAAYLQGTATDDQFSTDIDRLIGKYTPKQYRPQATRFLPGQAQTNEPKAKPGRPYAPSETQAAKAATLLARLVEEKPDHDGRIIVNQRDLAESFAVSPRTIRAWLEQLKAADAITTGQVTAGGAFFVRLRANADAVPVDVVEGVEVNDAPVLETVQSVPTRQTDSEMEGVLESTGRNINTPTGACVLSVSGELPPPVATLAPIVAYTPEGPGYSVGEVEYASGATGWVVWNDATDAIIARFTTEHAATQHAQALLCPPVPLAITPEPVLVEPEHDPALCASYDPAGALLPDPAPRRTPQPVAADQHTLDGSTVDVVPMADAPPPRWAAAYRRAINASQAASTRKQHEFWLRKAVALSHEDFYALNARHPWHGPKPKPGTQQRLKLVTSA